ncbi:DUF2182 domain-containing protein [Sinorhizobium numidicum]|uniref:DUF2182 domain-containing protein n=1 Tax=Sinorhizobium numidicum TaxID=680248 RepID=A0ABY8CV87_9HYPH|nr:DUF2182 domain-containing protein [Sinorhizobium numidicum]WEX75180.1 DUF2182 domain-containing protein [Sinorhizobium numidicum]WEX81173.1 DUF2182 domain-containing protein [Sinorhizobium numidicum]
MDGRDADAWHGWTMSMTWMRMPGQTWSAAAASFLGMWLVKMMMAMMLPSLVPMLRRYRQAVANAGEIRLGRLTTLEGELAIVTGAAISEDQTLRARPSNGRTF